MIQRTLLVAYLAALGANGQAQLIEVAGKSEVSGEVMMLRDIARLDSSLAHLSEVPIGNAPYPGHYRWLKKEEVERFLLRWGADVEHIVLEMEDQVLITRASQTVPQAMLEAKIRAFLSAQLPGMDLTITQMHVPGSVILPQGDIEVAITLGGALSNLAKIHLKLDFMVDGRHQKSQWARASVTARAAAASLVESVPYGHQIRRSDLELRTSELSGVSDHFGSIEEAVGNVTRRQLVAGEVLRRRDLKRPTLVKRGDEVTLIARGKSFVVSTTGRARDSGSMGDSIQIENLNSKQLVQGLIVGQRQVQVSLAEVGR